MDKLRDSYEFKNQIIVQQRNYLPLETGNLYGDNQNLPDFTNEVLRKTSYAKKVVVTSNNSSEP
jgi:hypothetical protein